MKIKTPVILTLAALVLASLACSVNINVPKIDIGETRTLEVNEALPTDPEPFRLTLEMSAGTFDLSSGADGLLNGTIRYNVDGWKPSIDRSTSSLSITQGGLKNIRGVPSNDVINDWKLKLSDRVPMDLIIKAGAYKGTLDLTGLRLAALTITDGASDSEVRFDAPNPEVMDTLDYKTGASQVQLNGLGFANFKNMSFEGAAGDYRLDFTGQLNQDADVTVKAGVCNLTIVIPDGMKAVIHNEGAVSNINTSGTWTVSDQVYSTDGEGYVVTINLNMGVSNIKLVHR
jgi:hypothetical protein